MDGYWIPSASGSFTLCNGEYLKGKGTCMASVSEAELLVREDNRGGQGDLRGSPAQHHQPQARSDSVAMTAHCLQRYVGLCWPGPLEMGKNSFVYLAPTLED